MSGPSVAKLAEYQRRGDGSCRRSFEVDGVTVYVEPHEDDERALAVACKLASLPPPPRPREEALERELADLRVELAKARGCIPPKRPARLFGTGYVRFEPNGRMWLLGNREKGWGSGGVWLDDWDDLFRRYNVRIVDHGTDEHGAWWAAEPIVEKEPAGE